MARYAALVVHGALHAQGFFERERNDAAERMEEHEPPITGRLGFADCRATRAGQASQSWQRHKPTLALTVFARG